MNECHYLIKLIPKLHIKLSLNVMSIKVTVNVVKKTCLMSACPKSLVDHLYVYFLVCL